MDHHSAQPAVSTNDSTRDAVPASPPTELEGLVAGIWAEVLGVDSVGLHDNFLLLGGESLLATQVVSQIRARCRCEIPIRSIFVGTVADVAAEIRALMSGAGAADETAAIARAAGTTRQ